MKKRGRKQKETVRKTRGPFTSKRRRTAEESGRARAKGLKREKECEREGENIKERAREN